MPAIAAVLAASVDGGADAGTAPGSLGSAPGGVGIGGANLAKLGPSTLGSGVTTTDVFAASLTVGLGSLGTV